MLQIEWKQKDKMEYGTCDKKILTPPFKRTNLLFDELKRGFFKPPPPVWTNVSFSAKFFLNASQMIKINICIVSSSFLDFELFSNGLYKSSVETRKYSKINLDHLFIIWRMNRSGLSYEHGS